MKDLSSSEDLEAPTPEFISLLDKMMNSLVSAQPEAASSEISTREKMSSISDALEKFKENLDPDLIKILNFIKDNPGIKNPELQDCPLSKFSKGVARRLSRNLLQTCSKTTTNNPNKRDRDDKERGSSDGKRQKTHSSLGASKD